MNINDYKDVNGNVEVSEQLISDLMTMDGMVDSTGTGIAIGQASTGAMFEVGIPAVFNSGITGISVDNKDMNTITETGFYYGYNMTNAKVTTISTFLVMNYSGDWVTQIQFVPDTNNLFFIRSRHNGTTWSTWRQI